MSSSTTSVLKHGLKVSAVAALLVAVLVIVPGSVVAQQATPSEQTITTDVHESGDATLAIQLQYDLTDDSEQDAFESITADETIVNETEDRFANRMTAVASAITNTTDRTVTVTDTSVSFTQTNTTGTVILEADLSNLAERTDDGSLVLTEPFASGFYFDGDVEVTAPDGYVIDATAPSADQTPSDSVRVWDADTSLDAFEVSMSEDGTTSTQTPGMGVIVGLLGVVLSIGFVAFNRRQ